MKPSRELLYQYSQSRRQAIEDCRLRAEKIRAEVPRLGEIAELRRDIAFEMGREIMARGEEARAAAMERMAVLEREEAELLIKAGYPGDWLSPKFRCALCQDTGYVGQVHRTLCPCIKRRMAEELFASSAIDKAQSFAAFREDVYPTEKQKKQAMKAKEICMGYAAAFPEQTPRDLLLTGPTGLGKSHLLNAIGLELAARGAVRLQDHRLQLYKFRHGRHKGAHRSPGFYGAGSADNRRPGHRAHDTQHHPGDPLFRDKRAPVCRPRHPLGHQPWP